MEKVTTEQELERPVTYYNDIAIFKRRYNVFFEKDRSLIFRKDRRSAKSKDCSCGCHTKKVGAVFDNTLC